MGRSLHHSATLNDGELAPAMAAKEIQGWAPESRGHPKEDWAEDRYGMMLPRDL